MNSDIKSFLCVVSVHWPVNSRAQTPRWCWPFSRDKHLSVWMSHTWMAGSRPTWHTHKHALQRNTHWIKSSPTECNRNSAKRVRIIKIRFFGSHFQACCFRYLSPVRWPRNLSAGAPWGSGYRHHDRGKSAACAAVCYTPQLQPPHDTPPLRPECKTDYSCSRSPCTWDTERGVTSHDMCPSVTTGETINKYYINVDKQTENKYLKKK